MRTMDTRQPLEAWISAAKGHWDTFDQALKWFSEPQNSILCVARRRWPDGIVKCPVCQSDDVHYLVSRAVWQCNTRHTKSQFSVRAGTIFEDSRLPLGFWLTAIWARANIARLSSHELARRLGITQKSAWSMLHRIDLARRKTAELNFQRGISVREGKSTASLMG